MGTSASKNDEQIGDNKASVRGSVSMDKNTEYSVILIHSGTAIGIIIVLVIIVAIYYLAFKIKCIHANTPNNNINNMERGTDMIQIHPKVEYIHPRFIEVRDDAEPPKKNRWISRDKLDKLFE